MSSPNFSLHGAVDLGARQAAAKRAQERQAQAGNGADSAYVVDVTDETFNSDVVQRSRTTPVLVDFWAEWCGPCKQLSPILEKLAGEAGGKWILAKVDIDANPQLAAYMQQMGIRGIPFVMAVAGGQAIPFLNGAAPEAQVRQAVEQLFTALEQEGVIQPGGEGAVEEDGVPEPEADPVAVAAEEALETGDLETAAAAFQTLLDRDPSDLQAKSGLALVELNRRVSSYADPAREIAAAAGAPADAAAQTRAADVEMAGGQVEQAFQRLVDTVRRTSGEDRDLARTHLLGLFDVLLPDDPRVTKARRSLQSALF